jgi:hypothetical protein
MNLELIVTIVLAMISSLIPTVYRKITDSANITNPYIIVAAVILGTLSACSCLFFNDSWVAWNFILLRCLYCYPRFYFPHAIFSKTKFKIRKLTLTMESN